MSVMFWYLTPSGGPRVLVVRVFRLVMSTVKAVDVPRAASNLSLWHARVVSRLPGRSHGVLQCGKQACKTIVCMDSREGGRPAGPLPLCSCVLGTWLGLVQHGNHSALSKSITTYHERNITILCTSKTAWIVSWVRIGSKLSEQCRETATCWSRTHSNVTNNGLSLFAERQRGCTCMQ
jgi:hypothetical protein